jgi:hypothetical protein
VLQSATKEKEGRMRMYKQTMTPGQVTCKQGYNVVLVLMELVVLAAIYNHRYCWM